MRLVYLCERCAIDMGVAGESLTVSCSKRFCDGGCNLVIGYGWSEPDANGIAHPVLESPFVARWPYDVWPIGLGLAIQRMTTSERTNR